MVVGVKDRLGLGEWILGDNMKHHCTRPGEIMSAYPRAGFSKLFL